MKTIERLRKELGGIHPLAANKVKSCLEPYTQAFIENASFAVMASADNSGNCDASPRGGKPGFTKVIDEKTLVMPDVCGNRLFQSFENFDSNPKAGFVFMIPGMDVTVRVNGAVKTLGKPKLTDFGVTSCVHNPDEGAILVQGLEICIDEVYFHCPRSFQFADLWNTETIARNRRRSLKSLKVD